MEQELEEARLQHEAELKRKLEEADKTRKSEVERTKQQAEQELNMQRDEYEDRLAELEKGLVSDIMIPYCHYSKEVVSYCTGLQGHPWYSCSTLDCWPTG